MVIARGQIWWADLGEPRGSVPGYRRPVLVVQSNSYNLSRINTVLTLVVSSNLSLRNMAGNVFVAAVESGLAKDSVVNVSQFSTLNKDDLLEYIGQLSVEVMLEVDAGLRRILAL